MFNLLPDILKEEFRAEYKKRWLIVVLIFVVFLQVSFLVLIFPTWALSLSKERNLSSEVYDISQSSSSKDVTHIASIIADTNTKLNIINTSMEYPQALPLINIIISNKIPAIHINEMFYRFIDKSDTTIAIGGVSDTREALVAFVKKLESSGTFDAVDLPVSHFAKDKNIGFSLTLKVSQ